MAVLASLGAIALAAGVAQAQQGAYTLRNATYTTVYNVQQDTGANIPLFSKVRKRRGRCSSFAR